MILSQFWRLERAMQGWFLVRALSLGSRWRLSLQRERERDNYLCCLFLFL